jgi:hypothetical protein
VLGLFFRASPSTYNCKRADESCARHPVNLITITTSTGAATTASYGCVVILFGCRFAGRVRGPIRGPIRGPSRGPSRGPVNSDAELGYKRLQPRSLETVGTGFSSLWAGVGAVRREGTNLPPPPPLPLHHILASFIFPAGRGESLINGDGVEQRLLDPSQSFSKLLNASSDPYETESRALPPPPTSSSSWHVRSCEFSGSVASATLHHHPEALFPRVFPFEDFRTPGASLLVGPRHGLQRFSGHPGESGLTCFVVVVVVVVVVTVTERGRLRMWVEAATNNDFGA